MLFITLLALLVLSVPLFFADPGQAPPSSPLEPEDSADLTVQLLNVKTSQLEQLDLEDYVTGVVAAEMPASFHEEALKAQAVVARTYAVRRLRVFGGQGCPLHEEADLCSDPATNQAYADEEEMRAKWGAVKYRLYRQRVAQAVLATKGEILVYDGQPIDAVYHSTSGGHTESAVAVWGQEVPYLLGVPSPAEEDSPRLTTEISMSLAELATRLNISPEEIRRVLGTGGDVIAVTAAGDSGRPTAIKVLGESMSAVQFRNQLDLPSTWFSHRWHDGKIIFTVRGYGHGVGMSQYGAQGMAEAGSSYSEILAHYYVGAQHRPLFVE